MGRVTKLAYKTQAFGAADTTKTLNYEDLDPRITSRGPTFIKCIEVFAPNWTNAVTLVLSVKSPHARQIYAAEAQNRNTVAYLTPSSLYVEKGTDIILTLSGAPGGSGGSVELDIYVEEPNA